MDLNPVLNVIATGHVIAAHETCLPWTCVCFACEDLRKHPELLEAIKAELTKPTLEPEGFRERSEP